MTPSFHSFKRLHKLDTPQSNNFSADFKASPNTKKVALQSAGGGKAVEGLGVAEKQPPRKNEEEERALNGAEDEAVELKEKYTGSGVTSVTVAEALSVAGARESSLGGDDKIMEVDDGVKGLRSRILNEDVVEGGKIVPFEGYECSGVGVRGAPLGPKRKYGGGDFAPLVPSRFINVIGVGQSGRRRGGGIGPGVARRGGSYRRGRGGSMGVAWISSGLGTLAPRPG